MTYSASFSKVLLVLGIFFGSICLLTAQPTQQPLPRNDQAIQLIANGKSYMNLGDFNRAAQYFQAAAGLPPNQSSTAAVYLSGLAYYYLGDMYQATMRFNQIILAYPNSAYRNDALYHRALIRLTNTQSVNRAEGLNDLFLVMDQSTNPQLVKDAYNLAKDQLFYRLDPILVDQYRFQAPAAYLPMVIEAICFRRVEASRKADAQALYDSYLLQGGQRSPFLDNLLRDEPLVHYYEPNVMKVGLMLPLFLEQDITTVKNLDELPLKSKLPLEFYMGMRQALADYSPVSRKKILLKVFDTRRDSSQILYQYSQLDSLYPDIVVGEIYNRPSRMISRWAASRGIPQVVPLSPTLNAAERPHMFLAHPSVSTHGKRMAEYAFHIRQVRKVAVWTDQRRLTERTANAFMKTFMQLGGEVVRVPIDSVYQNARTEIQDQVKALGTQGIQGYYVPISNEESCGLIISSLAYYEQNVQLMGGPSWQFYQAIDNELKEKYNLLFTTSFSEQNDSIQYQTFYNNYLRTYQSPPSQSLIQGYDLGMYLYQLLDRYDYKSGTPLGAYIRSYGLHRGLHLDFYFGEQQDNQMLHVCTLQAGKIFKVNFPNY
ncbi:MAG: ABC transporter substrate-binding protein [Bacteroidota bacterium]